jgi:MoaA/NifB/PqqE/SkfB family radical SAM enzyme
MCYFSDEEKRKSMRGSLGYEDIEKIARSLFHRALKLQVGCGAEPTLSKDLVRIIALGKQYKVPYISLTTNGNLLTREQLAAAVENGLNELTLSAHGFTRETYEYLMTNGKFDLFKQLLANVADIKRTYPRFKLRINYTINKDNLEELSRIWEVAGSELDILQLRPIQKIGNSEYDDFDLTTLYGRYDAVMLPLIEECRRRGITCLAPDKQNIIALEENKDQDDSFERITYCYVSPNGCWQEDFDYRTDTFESYASRRHLGKELLGKVFGKSNRKKVDVTRKMNYNIK